MNVVVDPSKAQRKAKRARKTIGERMHDMASLSARVAAFHAHEYTLPVAQSGNAWPFAKMAERIEEDVKSAYWTKDDDGWEWGAFELIKDSKNEGAAKDWWAEYKSGAQTSFDPDNPRVTDHEAKFDRMRGIPRSTKESEYNAIRSRHGGRYPRRGSSAYKALGMVRPERRANFIAKRKKTMGLAKAGWYAVHRGLIGRSSSIVTRGGKEEARRTFPPQIKQPFNRFGKTSLGGAEIKSNDSSWSFRIVNHVRYADEAFPDKLRGKVFSLIRRYIKIQADLRMKNAWKKGGRR